MRHTRLLTFVSGQYHSDVHKSWVSQCSSTLCRHLQYQGQQPLCSSPNLCYEVLVVSWSSQHSSRMRTPTCDNELCSNQLMSAWVKKLHDAKNLLYSFSSSLAFHKIKQKRDKKKTLTTDNSSKWMHSRQALSPTGSTFTCCIKRNTVGPLFRLHQSFCLHTLCLSLAA